VELNHLWTPLWTLHWTCLNSNLSCNSIPEFSLKEGSLALSWHVFWNSSIVAGDNHECFKEQNMLVEDFHTGQRICDAH
jgi:hypothetical protein